MKYRLLISALSLMVLSMPVSAAEPAKPPAAKQAVKPATPLTKLDSATKKMLEGLTENQTKQFALIRNNHGIIRAVEGVEKDIDAASKSCSEHNPEFAHSMQKRVGEWKAAVDPVLKDARERLDTLIKLQDFATPAQTRDYLKKVDEAVNFKSKSMKSVPVTEKKKCRKLLGSMDDNQKDLLKLMVESMGLDKPIVKK